MAEVKLSQKSYDELLKDIEILKNKENKFNEIIAELRNENTDLKVNSEVYYNTCKDWIKNYDELINDIADIKRKAEVWDKLKEYVLDKNETFSDRKDCAQSPQQFEYFENLLTAFKVIKTKMNDLERGSDE